MADTLSPAERSERMARIRSKGTIPEKRVRRALLDLGYRYRLHYPNAPGRPDFAFPGRKKAIFVHGCFWHGHPGCRKARTPKSRVEFWKRKLDENRSRDLRTEKAMQEIGWEVLVVWECELSHKSNLHSRLDAFLRG